MNLVNLTPHAIVLNDGTIFEKSGTIARVSATLTEVRKGMFVQEFGEVENLPAPKQNTLFIVSLLVFSATDRKDVIAPASGHKDVVRNEAGQIVSVPGFIVKE